MDGQKYAKEKTKELVARDLLQESSDFRSLRKVFQEMEYNKKGEPKAVAEEYKRFQKKIEDSRSKKAYGGLIDKPLTGGSRYI